MNCDAFANLGYSKRLCTVLILQNPGAPSEGTMAQSPSNLPMFASRLNFEWDLPPMTGSFMLSHFLFPVCGSWSNVMSGRSVFCTGVVWSAEKVQRKGRKASIRSGARLWSLVHPSVRGLPPERNSRVSRVQT